MVPSSDRATAGLSCSEFLTFMGFDFQAQGVRSAVAPWPNGTAFGATVFAVGGNEAAARPLSVQVEVLTYCGDTPRGARASHRSKALFVST